MVFIHSYKALFTLQRVVTLSILLMFFAFASSAQPASDFSEPLEEEYLSINVSIQGVGTIEIPAIVREKSALVSITSLFDYLKIHTITSVSGDSITGNYLGTPFIINKEDKTISYKGEIYDIEPTALINSEVYTYLQTDYLTKIFGLTTTFNFRSLVINIAPSVELPVIAEKRRETMRINLSKLTSGLSKADTVYKQTYPLFKFGMIDWSFINIQQEKSPSLNYATVAIGGLIAGGETNIGINYNSQVGFSKQQQNFLWRRVNNDNKYLRQVSLGKIAPQSIATIYYPLVGAQISNSPTYLRHSVGTYVLSDVIQPNWVVELYVNNVLVDYQKTGVSGLYKFDVPLVYGNSQIKLRFYGPWGEERTQTKYINIPFVFLPKGKFEYTVTAGKIQDPQNSTFAKAFANYGVTNNFKVGSGIEYLSSITSGKYLPYANATLLLAKKLMLLGEYTYGVRSLAALNYRASNDLQVQASYTKYQPGQTAIKYGYHEERKLVISKPFRSKNFNLFSKLTINQIVLPFTDYTTGEWSISSNLRSVGINISTNSLSSNGIFNLYTNASVTVRLPKNFLITPQVLYQYDKSRIISYKAVIEKYFLRTGYLGFIYEKNLLSNIENLTLNIRYDFSFGQAISSVKRINNQMVVMNSARGSVLFDQSNNFVTLDSRTANSRGGIVIIPFIDINDNGIRDKDEPIATGLKASVNGGRVINDRNGYIRIFDLERYATYQIKLDESSLNNIAWKIKDKVINVVIEPNHFREILVPVNVEGEASGFVYIETGSATKTGQRQILVHIENEVGNNVATLLSESDGYFSYLGLKSGNYKVYLDEKQLEKLGLKSEPRSIPITITQSEDGDVVDTLSFTLKNNHEISEEMKPQVKTDREEEVPFEYSKYVVQAGAFKVRANAEKMYERIKKITGKDVIIEKSGELNIIKISGFDIYDEAKDFKTRLNKEKIASFIFKVD